MSTNASTTTARRTLIGAIRRFFSMIAGSHPLVIAIAPVETRR
jgi:hypothetical protein